MSEAKKRNTKTKSAVIKKKDIKLNQDDINKSPKLTDMGYVWAG